MSVSYGACNAIVDKTKSILYSGKFSHGAKFYVFRG